MQVAEKDTIWTKFREGKELVRKNIIKIFILEGLLITHNPFWFSPFGV